MMNLLSNFFVDNNITIGPKYDNFFKSINLEIDLEVIKNKNKSDTKKVLNKIINE